MSIQNVAVDARTGFGKGNTKRLRKAGKIPSVVYGMGREALSISILPSTITQIIKSEKSLNSVLNLGLPDTNTDTDNCHVMIKSVDRHPVTDRLIHVDFMRIDMEKQVKAMVPLRFVGTPAGVKLGGVLTLVRHQLEIECLPKDLLSYLEVDVDKLGLEETLRIGDLPAIEGVTFKLGPTRMIAVIRTQKAVVNEVEEEEESPA